MAEEEQTVEIEATEEEKPAETQENREEKVEPPPPTAPAEVEEQKPPVVEEAITEKEDVKTEDNQEENVEATLPTAPAEVEEQKPPVVEEAITEKEDVKTEDNREENVEAPPPTAPAEVEEQKPPVEEEPKPEKEDVKTASEIEEQPKDVKKESVDRGKEEIIEEIKQIDKEEDVTEVKKDFVKTEDYEEEEEGQEDDNDDEISLYAQDLEGIVGEDVFSYDLPEKQSLRASINSAFMRTSLDNTQFEMNDPDYFNFDDHIDADLAEMEQKEEEMEERKVVKRVDEETIDKQLYIKLYVEVKRKTRLEQQKNTFLERRVVDFMRRRKLEQGLRDSDAEEDSDFIKRYKMQLTAFETQQEVQENHLDILKAEIESAQSVRNFNVDTKENLFHELQAREKEIGMGLIYSKTGKPISDNYVATLIERQNKQHSQISDMRLTFIKLRIKVQEVEDKLLKLEKIDSHLTLMDFEQLKLKFRSYVEKLEERDDELNRLRMLCQNSIQIMAHYKEKSSGMDTDLLDLADDLADMELALNQVSKTTPGTGPHQCRVDIWCLLQCCKRCTHVRFFLF
ncbi:unnamed protein product [Brassicogethes aeneus]|uniref:CCDC113/CCDC96 coiled-coil domain-containing protein n=1 Tax=Brassicogethes aeneus TaxID=1431903 RepID=A0A9P0FNU7_BRAAE|nr:unnamed protein product [Brassicogethes aeneus]